MTGLGVLILLVVLGTDVWALVDCYTHKPETGRSVFAWFVFLLALWIVAFPWYLAVRKQPVDGHRQPSLPDIPDDELRENLLDQYLSRQDQRNV